jgi:hypothetical protein
MNYYDVLNATVHTLNANSVNSDIVASVVSSVLNTIETEAINRATQRAKYRTEAMKRALLDNHDVETPVAD